MSQQLGILQQGQSLQQQQLAQQQQQESHPDQIQNPEPIPELPPDAVTSPAPGFPADPVKIEYILEQDRVVCDRAIAQALELYLAKDIGSAVDILVAAWKIINASCDDTRKVPLLDRLRVLANATEMSEHFEEQDFRFGAEPEFAKSLALIKLFVSRSVSRVVEHVFVSDGSFGLFLVEVLQKSLVDGATGVNLISDFLKDFASVITDLSKNSQIDRQEYIFYSD